MISVECVVRAGNLLGEGPVWDARVGALWWVDIKRATLQQYSPDSSVREWPLPEAPGSAALRRQGGLVLALASGVSSFDPETGGLEALADPEPDRPGNRFNEGACDPRGRFWTGSMDDAERARSGALYRIDTDHSSHRILDGWGIPNTLAWTADERSMYFADTLDRTIYRFGFEPEAGLLGEQEVFAVIDGAFPDGSAIDTDGCLWNAQWDGWRLIRYRPDGEIDRVVELPVQRPTSCAFGGKDWRTLYVTSARVGLSNSDLSHQPLAGGLFALEAGVDGVPETPFVG